MNDVFYTWPAWMLIFMGVVLGLGGRWVFWCIAYHAKDGFWKETLGVVFWIVLFLGFVVVSINYGGVSD